MGVAGLLVLWRFRDCAAAARRRRGPADGAAPHVGGLIVLVVLIFSGDPLDAALSGTAQDGRGSVRGARVASVLALFVGSCRSPSG